MKPLTVAFSEDRRSEDAGTLRLEQRPDPPGTSGRLGSHEMATCMVWRPYRLPGDEPLGKPGMTLPSGRAGKHASRGRGPSPPLRRTGGQSAVRSDGGPTGRSTMSRVGSPTGADSGGMVFRWCHLPRREGGDSEQWSSNCDPRALHAQV